MPFIHPMPFSLPNSFSSAAHAFRVVHDKIPQIVDALEPGGSGDPYAGLTEEERDALAETTRMGYPLQAWFDAERVRLQYTTVWAGLFDHFATWDPTYFDDFWTVPGYLGANPTQSLLDAKVEHKSKIVELVLPSEARALRAADPHGVGRSRHRRRAGRVPPRRASRRRPHRCHAAVHAAATRPTTTCGCRVAAATTSRPGSARRSSSTCARSRWATRCSSTTRRTSRSRPTTAIRCPPTGFPQWDQFRAAGRPIFPQRPQLLGPRFVRNNGAGRMDGRFAGKMIVVQCLLDEGAYPLNVDWYRGQVEAVLGDRADDQFRVWFVDRAMHTDPSTMTTVQVKPDRLTRIVSYRGVLEQALRDLAAWTERGIAPPASTEYEVRGGQVFVPATAAERRGIQAVVHLTANGGGTSRRRRR